MKTEHLETVKKFVNGESDNSLDIASLTLETYRKISELGYVISILTSSTEGKRKKQVHLITIRQSLSTSIVDVCDSGDIRYVLVVAFSKLIKKENL